MSFQNWLTIIQERGKLSDWEFASIKQFQGKLVKEISAEFTGDAVQLSHVVTAGKTFYLLRARLYPVIGAASGSSTNVSSTLKRTDVEIQFDGGAIVDVLVWQALATHGTTQTAAVPEGSGNANGAGQFENNIIDSFDGDGIKALTFTSTNTTGTYRVSLLGFEEDTGTNPST